MKISKIYSNQPDVFQPVIFNEGLNIIVGKIGEEKAGNKDPHNLGKSTFCQLIDFCLLHKFDDTIFLKKAEEVFNSFVFYLEVKVDSDNYITIKRSVSAPSKVSIKYHVSPNQDFSTAEEKWDHVDVAFDRAKSIIDSCLNLDVPIGTGFRHYLTYLMRGQDDYKEVFIPSKLKTLVKQWRPALVNILGLNGVDLTNLYSLEDEVEAVQSEKDKIDAVVTSFELGVREEDLAALMIKMTALLEEKKSVLKQLEISRIESEGMDEMVNECESDISQLNKCIYHIKSQIKLLKNSEKTKFNTADFNDLFAFFEEIKLSFKDGIKRRYEELVEFNKKIYSERRAYIKDAIRDLETELEARNEELAQLTRKRATMVQVLSNNDIDKKLDALVDGITECSAKIAKIEQGQKLLSKAKDLEGLCANKKEQEKTLRRALYESAIQADKNDGSILARTKKTFSNIIHFILGQSAVINFSVNETAKVEAKAHFVTSGGLVTYAADGNTYRKLLCIAFDMAVLAAHANMRYPHFVFHDGIFEAVDDSLKGKLLAQVTESTKLGIQHIITMIESDLPPDVDMDTFLAGNGEVVLTLSDEDENGLLFKGIRW